MCDCINQVNGDLKKQNTTLGTTIFLPTGRKRIEVPTYLIERVRGARPARVTANFCPFCGEKYPDTQKEGQATE